MNISGVTWPMYTLKQNTVWYADCGRRQLLRDEHDWLWRLHWPVYQVSRCSTIATDCMHIDVHGDVRGLQRDVHGGWFRPGLLLPRRCRWGGQIRPPHANVLPHRLQRHCLVPEMGAGNRGGVLWHDHRGCFNGGLRVSNPRVSSLQRVVQPYLRQHRASPFQHWYSRYLLFMCQSWYARCRTTFYKVMMSRCAQEQGACTPSFGPSIVHLMATLHGSEV